MIRTLLAALAAVLLPTTACFAIDAATCGYDQGAAGWYKRADRSGPYSLDGNCNATLIGAAGGSGGASTTTGSQEQDVRSSGTLNAASTASTIDIPINGQSTVGLRFSGLAASGATVSYLQSNDGGTTFTGVSEVNTATGVTSLTRTTDGQVRVAVQGRTTLRLQVTTAGTGTISVAWNVSVREGLVSLASPIPPGTNNIGFASPPASSAIGVQKTTGIGTTGTLVSASDPTNRRTVTNTSTLACELMGSAAAYGTGYPLPAGGSFTFDASGRTTAALYVACSAAGGTVAVLSY